MRKIPLTQGYFTIVDDSDFEELSKYSWRVFINQGGKKYARSQNKGKHVFLHRFLLRVPQGMETDHINGEGLDNRRSNLRICTRSQNMRNKITRKKTRTGYKGVTIMPNGRFQARIYFQGKWQKSLGCFSSAQEAGKTYNEAATKLFGEFAQLNKIP